MATLPDGQPLCPLARPACIAAQPAAVCKRAPRAACPGVRWQGTPSSRRIQPHWARRAPQGQSGWSCTQPACRQGKPSTHGSRQTDPRYPAGGREGGAKLSYQMLGQAMMPLGQGQEHSSLQQSAIDMSVSFHEIEGPWRIKHVTGQVAPHKRMRDPRQPEAWWLAVMAHACVCLCQSVHAPQLGKPQHFTPPLPSNPCPFVQRAAGRTLVVWSAKLSKRSKRCAPVRS